MYGLHVKVWLEKDGVFLVSEGRARLLRLIEEKQSIAGAAEEMGMSYRHAWGVLRKISEAAGGEVVKSLRHQGSTLTPLGRHILETFEEEKRRILDCLEKKERALKKEE